MLISRVNRCMKSQRRRFGDHPVLDYQSNSALFGKKGPLSRPRTGTEQEPSRAQADSKETLGRLRVQHVVIIRQTTKR